MVWFLAFQIHHVEQDCYMKKVNKSNISFKRKKCKKSPFCCYSTAQFDFVLFQIKKLKLLIDSNFKQYCNKNKNLIIFSLTKPKTNVRLLRRPISNFFPVLTFWYVLYSITILYFRQQIILNILPKFHYDTEFSRRNKLFQMTTYYKFTN